MAKRENRLWQPGCFEIQATMVLCEKCGEAYEADREHVCRRKNSYPQKAAYDGSERDRIIDAFRNCITEPKCKDCPWTECERLGNRKIEIPNDLALAVMRKLVEGDKWRWTPFNKRALTPEEKALHPGWCYIVDAVPGYDEDAILVTDGKDVWPDYFVNNGTECYLDSGREIEEGMAWMYLPEPYKEAKEHD